MYRIFREKRKAENCAAALAVLLTLALCSATAFGAITNGNHARSPYIEYQMNKTLTQTGDGYALELTAGGFDNYAKPIYTVLALDATSSMGSSDGAGGETRWATVLKAAKAYAETFFATNDGHEKYLAVVSFGYGARAHVTEGFAAKNGISAAASPARTITPDYMTSVSDFYIGGYRSDDKYIHAESVYDKAAGKAEGVENLLAFYNEFNRANFFFHKDKQGKITFGGAPAEISELIGRDISDRNSGGVLNNISQYSGTNNEAGLLLAKDLLDGAGEDAYKNVVLISDGESPATSTFARLYEQPLAEGVHLGNVYEKTTDAGLVQSLYDGLSYDGENRTVNFFDGNWHNVDYHESHGQRLVRASAWDTQQLRPEITLIRMAKDIAKTTTAAAVLSGDLKTYFENISDTADPAWTVRGTSEDTIDLSSDPAPQAFVKNIHEMLVALGAYEYGKGYIATGGAISADQAPLLNKAVKGLFWQGGTLTEPYDTMRDASDFSLMPNAAGKAVKSKLLDYVEASNRTNKYGSISARDFTGQSAGRVKAAGSSLYYIAVGNHVVNPDALEYYASDSTHTQHFYVAKQDFTEDENNPAYIGIHMMEGTLRRIAAESSAPARGAIIHDSLAQHFTLDLTRDEQGTVKVLQGSSVKRCYYDANGTQRERVYTFAGYASEEAGKIVADFAPVPDSGPDPAKDNPVRVAIGTNGKSIEAYVGTLWDTQTARKWAAGSVLPEELRAEEGVFYSKASVKFPVLVDTAAIGANNSVPSNDNAYFSFDDAQNIPPYISPRVDFPGGGVAPPPPPVEQPGEDGEEEEGGQPEEPTVPEEGEQTIPPGTPEQQSPPDVPPVPYSPGGTLVPQGDGSYLEIDEEGVPLGMWSYDPEKEAWIFDEEVPLANLPQTGESLPAAGFAHLWILPLLSLLWFGLIWPGLRRQIKIRAR
jgi:hypothetical protein